VPTLWSILPHKRESSHNRKDEEVPQKVLGFLALVNLIAFLIGCVICVLWRLGYRKENLHPLCVVFEHYHWFQISLIIWTITKIEAIVAFCLPFLIDEAFYQKHPFSIGSEHLGLSLSIGFIVANVLAVCVIFFL